MRELLRTAWVRLLMLLVLLLFLAWLIALVRGVLTPFVAAFALAYFLNPAVNAMERVFAKSRWSGGGHARTVAVGVLALGMVAVLAVFLLFVVPVVFRQIGDAAARMPGYAREVRDRLQPVLERLNLRYPEEYEEVRARIQEAVQKNLPEILSPATHAVTSAFSSLLGLALFLLHVVVIPVFTLYLLHDLNRIWEGLRDLVPPRNRDYVFLRAAEMGRLLSAFVRGQITVCLILGTFYAVALTLCDLPMGFLMGYLVAFFNLVPFMATVVGLPLVLLLSFLDQGTLAAAATVAAIFVFGHFVESHFLTPRIVGGTLGLHPVVILLAVLAGGTLFGFVGIFLAVPVTAALSVFWADLRDLYLQSEFYERKAP